MNIALPRPQQEIFLAQLKLMRHRAGLRQAELADKLDAPQSFVSKYESGERRIDILELRKICAACGSDLSAFIGALEEKLRE